MGLATAKDPLTAVNEAREAAGLPGLEDLDVAGVLTNEEDADGNKLSVGDVAWQQVMKKWGEGIKDGSISADDDRAKLYNALKASAYVESGVDVYTLSISEGVTTASVTGRDMESVIDMSKVNERIKELLGSEVVNNDLVAARVDALTKVEGGERVVEDLKEMAFSSDYAKHIQKLSLDPELKQVAEDDIAATYISLLAVDPEAATDFARNMQMNSLTMDLDALMADPSLISDENKELAGMDVGKLLLTLLKKGGLDLGRRSAEAQKFLEGVLANKKTSKEFVEALTELGAKFSHTGEVTIRDVERLIGGGKYKGLQTDGARAFFETMTKAGIIGSLGGAISLASGIYQLAGQGGKLADTPEERLGISKDFISFIGAGKHFADLGNNIIGDHNKNVKKFNDHIDNTYVAGDRVADEVGDDPRQVRTQEEIDAMKKRPTGSFLGLDKTLTDLLGAPNTPTPAGPHNVYDDFVNAFSDSLDATDNSDRYKRLGDEFEISDKEGEKLVSAVEDSYNTRPGVKDAKGNPLSGLQRGAAAALLIASAGADTFAGAADIVIGALTIKKGRATGNDALIAKGAIQLAAGGFGLSGGVGAGLGLLKGLQAAKAAAAPALLASAVLSIITIIPDIVLDIKKTDEINNYRDELQDFIVTLNDQGLLTEDGLNNFRFLDAYMYSYGQRDTPEEVSIFEYRAKEAEHFHDFWNSESGQRLEGRGQFSSTSGLDHENHKDYKGDGANLDTLLDY